MVGTARALSAVLALLIPLMAGNGAVRAQDCATCGGVGSLPCRGCGEVAGACEGCTVAARCAKCRGAGAIACECATAGILDGLARRRAAAAQFLTAHRAMLAGAGIAERDVQQCRTVHFDLVFANVRIEGGAERDAHRQLHSFATRLEAMRTQLLATIGRADVPAAAAAADPATRVRIVVAGDARDARRLCLALTGLESQGLGGRGAAPGSPRAAVLWQDPALRDEAALQRLLAHQVAHLVLADDALADRGLGWLEAGLAHWLEAAQPGARCEHVCVLGRPQPPRRFHGGDWRTGARELLDAGRLPALADTLATEIDDLDLAQHAVAFTFVEFLLARQETPRTGGDSGTREPTIVERILAAAASQPASSVLPAVLGRDLASIEADYHAFVRAETRR